MVKHYALAGVVLLVFSLFLANTPQAVSASEALPAVTLTIPENKDYRDYLGLSGAPGEPFTIADIKADIVLIELFSMYCPYCQAEAPRVNEFHQLALEQQENGVKIRVVGLGASNTQFEVEYFKDTYDIQFPLFPDKNLSMYKTLGGEGTPGFLGCVLRDGKQPQIILRESGGFDSPEEFLAMLLQKAGYR